MALPRIDTDGPYYEVTIHMAVHEPKLSMLNSLQCVGNVQAYTLRTELTVYGDLEAALDEITDILLFEEKDNN